MNKIIILILLVTLTGCTTLLDHSNTYNFPADIKASCQAELKNAKDCLKTKGVSLKENDADLTVLKMDGVKKVNGEWLYKSVLHNNRLIYGCAYYDVKRKKHYIEVACNPNTKGEVSPATLKHEFGHFWLISNWSDLTHNSKYKDCFVGWKEMQVKMLSDSNKLMVIDLYIEDELGEIQSNDNCN